jgi:beta-ureidopropionase / N-carbamoyl-L-amino-acid hydrolase
VQSRRIPDVLTHNTSTAIQIGNQSTMSEHQTARPRGGKSELAGAFGPRVLQWADRLAEWSEAPHALTCTYLTPAHRRVAAELARWMTAAGMATEIDAVGNVVARLRTTDPKAKTVILASHYDTVTNAGKYDGRLGVLVALVVAEHLQTSRRTLPFHLEIIAFSEEEGVRFSAPYIGSSAVAGRFVQELLERRDANGLRLDDVMRDAGLDPGAIPSLARSRDHLRAYLEVHIEQGPVLLKHDIPVGIVTSIAGDVRYLVTVTGAAGHAGTVPMTMRHDAAAAAAEIILYVERRCVGAPTLVGTVGKLNVPDGAINVIPGRCDLSLDIRSGDDAARDAAIADILAEIGQISLRRQVTVDIKETMRVPAVPCSPAIVEGLAAAVERAGLPVARLASGAGHDAVMFDGLTDIGMLFVRCGNDGISHSPLETVIADDVDVAARVLLDVLIHLDADTR